MTPERATMVLRLAGPLQSWGVSSQFNRRSTADRPSKSGVIGLLAAAQGRRRGESITDLLDLSLGVRVDQPGTLLRDYHTVSRYTGEPLPSASVNAKGVQKKTSPKKPTHVTHRYYLQDAVFVTAVSGQAQFIVELIEAIRRPRFPLALGRRSCPPAHPLLLAHEDGLLWPTDTTETLHHVPWQKPASPQVQRRYGAEVTVAATIDDPAGSDELLDVPMSFEPRARGFQSRRVRHDWITLETGLESHVADAHDPFALLGW